MIRENHFDSLELAPFVEADFPFITIPLDAHNLGEAFPDTNIVARGLAIQLGNSAYMCFDMDLLRWSVAWSGDFIPMILPAQVSYHDFFKKNNDEIPRIPGRPALATGIYPGWSVARPDFSDDRPVSQQVEGVKWGPISAEKGRWEGVHVHGNRVLLAYRIGRTEIMEMPGSEALGDGVAFTRTFNIGASAEKLFINLAEVNNGQAAEATGRYGHLFQGIEQDSVTIAGIVGDVDASIKILDNRFMVVEVPPAEKERTFTVALWKGAADLKNSFEEAVPTFQTTFPDYRNGGETRWDALVTTQGQRSPDTAAFVTDVLTLPLPNPWARNVRVADVAFFDDGRAAISTYEGDVWIVSGINNDLNRLRWKRFASGLYEPMSIEVVNGHVFVYAKEGIVRLVDLNGDDEADYYENFSNIMNQSTGTREWAADMVADKEGNFYIAKGGHLSGTRSQLPFFALHGKKTGYGAGSAHTGTIMKVSADGETTEIIATGLRMPYMGLNRTSGFITASDQQGNYVPATPIYHVSRGDYFGVPITAHEENEPEISDPITWIPHRVDRSAISQTWIDSKTMGPLNGQMVHFSFGRPGIFRVLIDSLNGAVQGGVTPIETYYPAPVMKGEIHPKDGFLYIAGFNNYATNSLGISALTRLRYTGKPSYMLSAFQAVKEGIVLSFDSTLDERAVTDVTNYRLKRWDYKRTAQYGSGHYRLDGTPGEEEQPVLAAYLSSDRKQILLLVPDMAEVDQMEVLYNLVDEGGNQMDGGLWFTLYRTEALDLKHKGFRDVDFNRLNLSQAEIDALIKVDLPVTVDRGRALFAKTGCQGCHSTAGRTDGMYGPPFQGLYGSRVELEDGSVVTVDEAYLRESILDPSVKIVKGYRAEMPSYEGVLSEPDLQSIILFIKTLPLASKNLESNR